MRAGFYPHLAMTGIRKNKNFYIPYILTCAGMVMMNYIVNFLATTPTIDNMIGGDTVKGMLGFGRYVIALFAVIFLFYTNSFLMRRRKKEFGLYNILGMGKKNIGCLLFCETVIIAVISLTGGLAGGMLFSKLSELGLVKLLGYDAAYDIFISLQAIGRTAVLFCVIFVLLLFNALRQIHMADPVTLFYSDNVGEKPPKANWILGLGGLVLLGGAYYMAVTIKQPLSALLMFFVAVAMVIVATYLLFICGSVLFCRILQKNKGYYYKANHFISVSSMVYRMKRNGAGLASICILATMVLVMITGSACLYFGAEDSLHSRYPYDININTSWHDLTSMTDENRQLLLDEADRLVAESGVKTSDSTDYNMAQISGLIEEGGVLQPDVNEATGIPTSIYERLRQVYFVSVDDYNKITGENVNLGPDQAMVYTVRCDYDYDVFTPYEGKTYEIVSRLEDFQWNGQMAMDAIPSVVFIVSDISDSIEPYADMESNGMALVYLDWYHGINIDGTPQQEESLSKEIDQVFSQFPASGTAGVSSASCESLEVNRSGFYGTFGGLFFLGIILSIVFIFATTLIIYYKQISEGYEDRGRFDIMQKVGMTKRDIRKSVNSQVITVFFLPLVVAVMHLAFAFPMIRNLLLLFNLNNLTLLMATAGISVVIFAVFYVLVYKITSNAYYNIVSGSKKRGRVE